MRRICVCRRIFNFSQNFARYCWPKAEQDGCRQLGFIGSNGGGAKVFDLPDGYTADEKKLIKAYVEKDMQDFVKEYKED